MDITTRTTVIIIVMLALASAAYAQKNQDVCRVTTDTWSVSGGYGTGIYDIGKFPVDDFEDGAKKVFRYETDGRVYSVEAEVEYGDFRDVEKGKPIRIIISLLARLADGNEKTKSILPVEAETSYRYKFGTVAVSSHVVTGDVAQHFQLMCSDGISKSGVQRGNPIWLKKAKSRKDN